MNGGIPKPRVVYIIDDDPSAQRGLERLMKSHGFDVTLFASARDLLMASLPPANVCLISDVAMPEMDGLQMYAELRRRGCQAPVIFITALDDPALRESAIGAGASAFFRKPVDGDALRKAIEAAKGG